MVQLQATFANVHLLVLLAAFLYSSRPAHFVLFSLSYHLHPDLELLFRFIHRRDMEYLSI